MATDRSSAHENEPDDYPQVRPAKFPQAAPEPVGPSEPIVIPRRELLAVAIWTIVADLTIFRAYGFSGPAVFFAATIPILLLRHHFKKPTRATWLCSGLLGLIVARLLWSGSGWAVFTGMVLVAALAIAAAGFVPMVIESLLVMLRSLGDGAVRVMAYRIPVRKRSATTIGPTVASIVLPLLAALIFAAIFVLANPSLRDLVGEKLNLAGNFVWGYFRTLSFWEILFCLVALLVGAGLIQPRFPDYRFGPLDEAPAAVIKDFQNPLHSAYRNTLVTLIALFAIYLGYEFMTLWRRDFPPGFYYAGYAHQGAAWLTVALALATVMLSWIFSGETLRDRRTYQLKRLAWGWSIANFLLALAVYHRLSIYVGYNGMTRLRIVGFFGISLVVIGFCLVLFKIRHDRGFWWLLRAQLLAFAMAVLTYSLFPVDYVAHRYNAWRVAASDLHPSVMIVVKPIDDEGMLPLIDLSNRCEHDPIIRDGVLALLARRQEEIESRNDASRWHWTRFQGASSVLYRALKSNELRWASYTDDEVLRSETIERFRIHAMKWY